MKRLILAAACLLAGAPTLFSQCVVTKTQSLCDCQAQFADGLTSITGDIYVADAGKSTITFPETCGETVLTLGNVNITIGDQDLLIIPNKLNPDGNATALTLKGETSTSRLTYHGIPYFNDRAPGTFGSFSDAESDLRRYATSLPVTLQYWTAARDAEGVNLRWASVEEKENDFYAVEYSHDGRTFTEVGRIDGRVSSHSLLTYQFHHRPVGGGTHYYRLSQQDFDGARTSYAVFPISVEDSGHLSGIYPNPARAGQQLNFQAPMGTPAASLLSLDGREVARFVLNPETAAQGIALPGELSAGVYLLQAGGTNHRVVVR